VSLESLSLLLTSAEPDSSSSRRRSRRHQGEPLCARLSPTTSLNLSTSPQWNIPGIRRNQYGYFEDKDLVNILSAATKNVAGAFKARGELLTDHPLS